jgi:hypothetical protein
MLKINCTPVLTVLICHPSGAAGELQHRRKWEAQRAVDETNIAKVEEYKQVQSDSRHLINTRGI